MAFETGTATDHTDLFNKLVSFLKTNTDLVADGAEWSEDWAADPSDPNPTAVVLSGSVASGDSPKVGLQLYSDSANSQYEIQLLGVTNTLAGATQLEEHANVSPITRIFADPNPMTYWFTASGRRFIVAVKISAVYSTGYFGLFLPYALPTTYPYPMLISGAAGTGANQINDWRSTDDKHASLGLPFQKTSSPVGPPSATLLSPAGQWETVANPSASGGESGAAQSSVMVHPFYGGSNPLELISGSAGIRAESRAALDMQVEAFGTNYAAHPVTLFRQSPASQIYGVMDGVLAVQGRNNAAENIISVGVDDYMVLQDAFRSDVNRYIAVLQE